MHLLQKKKQLLWVQKKKKIIPRGIFSPTHWLTWKGATFERDPQHERVGQQVQSGISSPTTRAIPSSRPYIIEAVSSGKRHSVEFLVDHQKNYKAGSWSLMQGHSIFRGDLFPLWGQLLGSYWALVEMEYLTMGCQVTVPELVIKSWVMLETSSHKIKQAQQQSMLNLKW